MYYATRSAVRDGAALALNESNLSLHAERIQVPGYDRSALENSVVHFGVGGFHRAHQALYLDELAASGVSLGWGVTGVSLRRRAMKEALAPQDGLYTVMQRGAGAAEPRVVGSISRFLFAPEEPSAVLAALTDPRVRLVTLTVTGDGYAVDSGPSGSAIAYIVEALRRRRRAGLPAFTVLSCDNLPANGEVARAAVTSSARLRDEGLANWITENVAFPSSVVDRITPQTTTELRRELARDFGIADRWPVATEPFTQWTVEDTFSNGRPPLDEVGVDLVSDIRPFELMKKRLLNGSHCALGYVGSLTGFESADEAMADPRLRAYISALMDEVWPLLPEVPHTDIAAYQRTLLERFGNPEISDQLTRLCARGSTKMPAYLLPSLAEAVEARRPHRLLLVALAAWVRYLHGTGLDGRAHEVEDRLAAELAPLARAAARDARPLLARTEVFGDLGEMPGVADDLSATLREIEADGLPAVLDAALCSGPEVIGTR